MSDERTYALRGLLHAAGIQGAVTEIPNRYWPEHPDYQEIRARSPWLRVYTERGVLVLGWRKRVISIEWKESVIDKHGSEVVADPSTTHDDRMCHAWGYAEAAGCLLRLWGNASRGDREQAAQGHGDDERNREPGPERS